MFAFSIRECIRNLHSFQNSYEYFFLKFFQETNFARVCHWELQPNPRSTPAAFLSFISYFSCLLSLFRSLSLSLILFSAPFPPHHTQPFALIILPPLALFSILCSTQGFWVGNSLKITIYCWVAFFPFPHDLDYILTPLISLLTLLHVRLCLPIKSREEVVR